MRVVIVTESFPPDVNGVAHCALQTARHLVDRGHHPLVVAPAGTALLGRAGTGPDAQAPCPVVRVPSLPLPGYPQVRVALPSRRLAAAVVEHRADIVHLASPFVLGVRGMAAAARLGIPAVAVYQTDLAGYARTYMGAGEAAAWRRIRSVHAAADLTLAPSSASLRDLEAHEVPRVKLWPRGVDTVRFRPGLRDPDLRRELAPNGELIVGYVGRLAPEKHVELLSGVCGLEGVRVVVVGDGPSAPSLTEALPGAVFLGRRTGDELARIYASLDVFAHTGPFETFCQTVQEAMASGVPVVAPAVGGPLDLVAHERTGLLVPPHDADAVRDAVRSLIADPERRFVFGATARATVEGRTWAAVGDQLIGHYADVLAARKKTAVAA
ncbi:MULTISPECIES: glycosyltransferase family 4 protein [Streptomyces]|uniref:Glycosyltransferase family 1 protein n=1 Tax=Streptomyces gilvifuscus TaxID=1550617 RepID=A0ABT5G8M3_9ACTN|nr:MULTISPECIES: glycosyltransferase family 1 protein [Streptomyces]MBK3639639.1 glycosyltransferase family 1 protein [Streptomyces sp. MBT33]MDC2961191.1 glycosyltransferase family 1 protein [Streptomyces gilvifuscus]